MKKRLFEIGAADGRVREFPLSGDEFLIGRGEDCDLCIHEPDISRHHCLIRNRGHKPVVTDLGSSNGTYINGHRLLSQVELTTGDELQLGPCRYIVDLGDDPNFRLPDITSADPLLATRTVKDIKRNR